MADVVFAMSAGNVLIAAERCFLTVKLGEMRMCQHFVDRLQAVDTLGMSGRGHMLEASGVGEESGGHRMCIAPGALALKRCTR